MCVGKPMITYSTKKKDNEEVIPNFSSTTFEINYDNYFICHISYL